MRNLGLQLVTTLLLMLTTSDEVNCGRILILSPATSFSHQIVYQGLAVALQKRGHEIVMLTPNPKRDPTLANYTEIDFSKAYELMQIFSEPIRRVRSMSPLEIYHFLDSYIELLSQKFYEQTEIQKLINGGEKFDVAIVEALIGYAPMAVAYKLKIPIIGIMSTPLHLYHLYTIGNPILPSHRSNWEFHATIGSDMTFRTKVNNYIMMLRILHFYDSVHIPKQNAIARQALGDDIPSVMDIAKNVTLFLSSFDPVIDDANVLPPNVIPIDGFHIEKKPPALPTELDEFLGNGTDGFIYMSLGSNVKTWMISTQKVKEIYNAFSRLPCKVLWKCEADYLPRKKNNILISNWFPQQSIIAHPNIKVFIFQGGLQSTEETVHHGVPIVGIPVIFEQGYRIKRLVSLGVGRSINLDQLEEETFYETVLDVLTNPRYTTNMKELQRRKLDKPYNSMQHSVWWVEYIMRHKTAAHLRFSETDNPWYQRDNLDVIAFLSIVLFLVTVACAMVLVQSVRLIYRTWLRCTIRGAMSTLKDKKVQ